jgi:N-methylhydantoinase A/oxoprolinase/acetone carboxylase beta subunit
MGGTSADVCLIQAGRPTVTHEGEIGVFPLQGPMTDIHTITAGMVRIVNNNMVGALRVVSVEKGHDPRAFALIAFGGAGPMHAGQLAERWARQR